MTDDRELLRLAAKAAGIELYWPDEETFDQGWAIPAVPLLPGCQREKRDWRRWNPLTDDGDALRLAVAVSMKMSEGLRLFFPDKFDPWAVVKDYAELDAREDGEDPCAATRRAIVRAAAALAS